ncbi:MAG: hypothetical protein AAGE65_06665 [Planctomycetota bacterium]
MSDFEIVEPSGRAPSPSPSLREGSRALRALPASEVAFDVRRGTLDDLPWVDAMQKADRLGLGFRFMEELKGHVREGNLWVAERRGSGRCPVAGGQEGTLAGNDADASASAGPWPLGTGHCDAERVAYCIARDRYMKRDEVGLIVQMCVAPAYRRSLVAANLLARVFDAWPRGVRLCGCWCAQDLPANRFWEACGFRALAFRTGARESRFKNDRGETVKGHRVHVYWQKKVRGERDPVDYWYPGETGGGSLNESRLVFPIPPGTSWRDAKPAVLPGVGEMFEALRKQREEVERKALLLLASPGEKKTARKRKTKAERVAEAEAKAAAEAEKSVERKRREAESDAARATAARGGLRFAPLPPDRATIAKQAAEREALERAEAERAREADAAAKQAAKAEAKRAAKAAVKKLNAQNDPALKAMARELRDRWMEAVRRDAGVLSLASETASRGAAYDVARQIEAPSPGPSRPRNREGSRDDGDAKRARRVGRLAA